MNKKRLFIVILIMAAITIIGCTQEYEVEPEAKPEEAGEVKGEGTYKEGEEVTVEAEPAEGYSFEKWTENGEKVSGDKNYEFEVNKDRKLTAEFKEEVEVSLKANHEGGGKITGDGTYKKGEEVIVEAEPAEGYSFKNWSENGKEISTEKSYNFDVKEDRKLVAEFQNEGDLNGTLAEAAQALEEERWAKAGEYLAEAEEMPGAEEKQIYKDIDQYVIEALKNDRVLTRDQIASTIEEMRPSRPDAEILEGEPEDIYNWFQNLSEWKSELESFPNNMLDKHNYDRGDDLLFREDALEEIKIESKKYMQGSVGFELSEFNLWGSVFFRRRPVGKTSYDLRDRDIFEADNQLIDVAVKEDSVVITLELKERITVGIYQGSREYRPGEIQLIYDIHKKDDGMFSVI